MPTVCYSLCIAHRFKSFSYYCRARCAVAVLLNGGVALLLILKDRAAAVLCHGERWLCGARLSGQRNYCFKSVVESDERNAVG